MFVGTLVAFIGYLPLAERTRGRRSSRPVQEREETLKVFAEPV